MTLTEFYTAVGGSCEDTLSRIPSEAMLKKFIGRFPSDPSYSQLKDALAAGDLEGAFRAAHTLKGVAQNLGLGALGASSSDLTEILRPMTALPAAEAVAAVDAAYRTVLESAAQLA